MAGCLQERGLAIVTGGTDSHLVLVDLRGKGVTGVEMEERCRAAGIILNKNMVPGDQLSPRVTSGIRIGTAAATTRGLGIEEMGRLAEILADLVGGVDPENFRGEVGSWCETHPIP